MTTYQPRRRALVDRVLDRVLDRPVLAACVAGALVLAVTVPVALLAEDDTTANRAAAELVAGRVDELEADVRALEDRIAALEAALYRTDTRLNGVTKTGHSGSRYEAQAAPAPAGDAWHAMAACESTGDTDGVAPHRIDKRATSPSGQYGGALQWDLWSDPPTWQAAGGTGDPRDATLETELAIGAAWAARGDVDAAGQWPTCYPLVGRRLGIPR